MALVFLPMLPLLGLAPVRAVKPAPGSPFLASVKSLRLGLSLVGMTTWIFFPRGPFTWVCDVPGCAFAFTHASKHSVSVARYRHNKKVHHNQNQVGRPAPRVLATVMATENVTLGWTCPFCSQGFPEDLWQSACTGVRLRSVRAHRLSEHTHVSIKVWKRRVLKREKAPLSKQRRRALNLNAAKPNAEFQGFDTFLWPCLTPSRGTLRVRHAGRGFTCDFSRGLLVTSREEAHL